ncbi:MAG: DUF4258 domain-containing protein [Desulfobaccales bacterium]
MKTALEEGSYFITFHASRRMLERDISRKELFHVLSYGHREEAKDHFTERMRAWTYAVRGRTAEGRELRIAVAIMHAVAVVTVIDLQERGDDED